MGSGRKGSGESKWKPQVFLPTLPGAIASIRAAKSKHVSALNYFRCNNLGIFSPLMFLVVTKHTFFLLSV